MTTPCKTCPWRKGASAKDIPRFSCNLLDRLENTVGEEDAFRPIMACHGSTEGNDTPCVGYVYVEGWSNLAVRMLTMQGRLPMKAIDEACAELDLYGSFAEMSAALKESEQD